MKLLLRKKEVYTKSLNKATQKHLKDSYWEKIVLIQKDIHKQAVKRFSEEHYPLWNALSKIDCSTNAQEFWKTIKKFRRKESDDVFPNVMTPVRMDITSSSQNKASKRPLGNTLVTYHSTKILKPHYSTTNSPPTENNNPNQ